jgi:hypothetical protein
MHSVSTKLAITDIAKCPVAFVKLDVPILTTRVCGSVTLSPFPAQADIIDSPTLFVKSSSARPWPSPPSGNVGEFNSQPL